MPSLFSVPIFFILFRETVEAAIIVSVLLALIDKISATSNHFQLILKQLKRQVWIGTISGLLLSFAIGSVFLVFWYKYAIDLWASAESLWEGVFGLIAAIMVTVTAVAMLKGTRMYEKYSLKLARKLGVSQSTNGAFDANTAVNSNATGVNQKTRLLSGQPPNRSDNLSADRIVINKSGVPINDDSLDTLRVENDRNSEDERTEALKRPLKALFWLPFITMLREGLEAFVFIGGVSLSEEPTSIPIAAIVGIILGVFIGFLIHSGGSRMTLHWFFVVSSCFLLLVANGLLVKAIGNFEDYVWSNATNLQADDVGTGSFDPRRSVWHFDCCSPEDKTQGWGVFSAVLGWRNNATIATVTVYCLYWIGIAAVLIFWRFNESRQQDQADEGQSTEEASSSAKTLPSGNALNV
ncbi:hypothetical protein BASA50_003098 [Batrachochytrium salamandrivorans]|uniref:Plasma membrane iron permease n=1 Tax=Batrachochytrium salamandrivorans TaxID=1357716 RepID=A0ABQ8FJW3_9FUNG|nr:hypothetical protein BASA60_008717 [Batrachochytrium salamandrivorans]KAH6582034.1 hypothetical protein BASA61_008703 [Batrachochytrium salamandrivorans]KAH6599342.1 hypothetical protein BASA50_003098 [Batrachochytrium salamandrivorans]